MAKRAKSARVDFKSYETEAVAQRFDAVGKQLLADFSLRAIDNSQLAQLTARLIQLNDDVLGRNAEGSREITKLPMRLFHDYKPTGSVYVILKTYHEERNSLRFQPLPVHEAVRLLKRIYTNLKDGGFIKFPSVYIDREVKEPLRSKLIEIIKKHGAQSVNKAQATHLVYLDSNPPPEGEEQPEYLRTLQTRGNLVLVHWWYFPDSYDTWLTTNDIEGTPPETRPPRTGPWRVTSRWLTDLEMFNEWMNELDYEVDTENTVKQTTTHKSIDDIDIVGDSSSRKRALPPGAEEPAAKRAKLSEEDNQPLPLVIPVPIERPVELVGQRGITSRTKEFNFRTGTSFTNISNAVDPQITVKPESLNPKVVVKSHQAKWFNYDQIHEIEKRSLPEFFDGKSPSKTPKIYTEYRNFMIQTYEQNPNQYLTQTACRRNLAGDVCAILRVHSFLEHWGLINYRVNPDLFPVPAPKIPTAEDTAQVIDTVVKFNREKPTINPNLALRRNIFAGGARKSCKLCKIDCTYSYYSCQRKSDYNLCPICYSAGKYDDDIASSDFLKHENEKIEPTTSWTDQETLRLLEAIEKYPDNWDKVSEEVGTKTKAECIVHFIRMPIEEPYLDSQPLPAYSGSSTEDKKGKQELGKDGISLSNPYELPFSAASNPIMSMVAFLASVVKPSVAAAAAQAALSDLINQDKEAKRKQQEAGEASGSTSMEVDGIEDEKPKQENGEEEKKDKEEDLKLDIKAAAAAGLGAAALKARMVVATEEREIQKLVAEVIELQIQKLELKLQNFESLEKKLETERQEIEKLRQQLHTERLSILAKAKQISEASGSGSVTTSLHSPPSSASN